MLQSKEEITGDKDENSQDVYRGQTDRWKVNETIQGESRNPTEDRGQRAAASTTLATVNEH